MGKSPKPCRVCGKPAGFHLRPSRIRKRDHVCRECEGGSRFNTLAGAEARAKAAGLPFSLTKKTLPPVPECCPICDRTMHRGIDTGIECSPSLDKIVPKHGYVPDNVAWICMRCNSLKSNATLSEMYLIADWLWEEYKRRGLPLPRTRLHGTLNQSSGSPGKRSHRMDSKEARQPLRLRLNRKPS